MSVLLRGGRIHSPAAPHATAMLVVDGRVAWLGSDGGALVHADGVDQVVELGGAYVAPAFVDAHVHHTATGLALLGLDLRPARSLAEALGMLAGRARAGGSPIVGHGWDETAWPEGRPPTRPELDRAAGGAVVYLSRVDVHSAVVSSALVAAVPGLVDAVGFGAGPLTQHAHEQARRALTKTIPGDLRRAAQRAARQHAAASGVAALHEMAGPSVNGRDDLRALVALAAAEPGPELTAYWGEAGALDELAGLGAIGAAGDLFVDGSLGSRTALLRDPYADAGGFGVGYLDGDQVAAHLVACTGAGISGGFHAIGDAAVGLVVEGIRVAVQRCGLAAVRAARHRIEHLVMCSPAEAEVLAHAGVVGSIQPQFDATWGGPGGAYEQRLGPVRAARVNDFAAMSAAGMMLAIGSDSPVTPIRPWEAVRAAAWPTNPHAALTTRAAFAAATRGGWRAAGRDELGVLVPGAEATFAVWDAVEFEHARPRPGVRSWSTDPRSGTPPLPDLTPGRPAPTCLATVLRGQAIHVDRDRGLSALEDHDHA